MEKRLSEFNLLKKKNLKDELYLVLKEINRIQQTCVMKNDIMKYHEYKEKSSVLLDIWRQVNNPKIHENYVERYIDAIILLIENIGKTNEGFSIPRDPSGKLVKVGDDIIKLYKLHKNMYVENNDEKSVWQKIIKQRKENKSVIDILVKKNSKDENKKNFELNHVFLHVKAILFKSSNKTRLRFSLYDRKKDKFITDSYDIGLDDTNFDFIGVNNSLKAVFRDIEEITEDLFLVCKIFKRDDNDNMFPFGTFCVPIRELRELKSGKIHNPSPKISNIYTHHKTSNFIHLHKLIIIGDKNIQIAKNSKSIVVSLFSFKGNLNEILKKNKDKNLKQYEVISCFNEDEKSVSLKERNDMQITLVQGKFTQENIKYVTNQKVKQINKKKPKNIQVCARLLHFNGEFLKNCFHFAADSLKPSFSVFKTFIYSHENMPVYKEKFYIKIEEEILLKSYLYLEYRHVSLNNEKTCVFGFSFIPLGNKKKILDNDSKDLSVYCASNILDGKLNFNLSKDFVKRKDRFILSTFYNSTQYSQNDNLNKLLHWGNFEGNVDEILKNISDMPSRLFIKCFRKTFESLFTLLVADLAIETKNSILYCIVHIIDKLTTNSPEKMSITAKHYLKRYIEEIFDNSKAHLTLTKLIKIQFETDKSFEKLKKTLLCIEYIFLFIINSEKNDNDSQFSSVKEVNYNIYK